MNEREKFGRHTSRRVSGDCSECRIKSCFQVRFPSFGMSPLLALLTEVALCKNELIRTENLAFLIYSRSRQLSPPSPRCPMHFSIFSCFIHTCVVLIFNWLHISNNYTFFRAYWPFTLSARLTPSSAQRRREKSVWRFNSVRPGLNFLFLPPSICRAVLRITVASSRGVR